MILLPPWRRAPLLPFGQPAVILAVVGAAAILACASASALLFLSSASSESLRRIVAEACPDAPGVAVTAEQVGTIPRGVTRDGMRESSPGRRVDDGRLRQALTGQGLADPYRVSVSEQSPLIENAVAGQAVRLFHRDGVAQQITPLAGPVAGSGVWLPYRQAYRMRVEPGDSVRLSVSPDNRPSVRVVGIYRDLFDEPVRPFWCSYATLFQSPGYGSDNLPPPLVIPTDAATLARIRDAYGGSSTESWVSPVDTRRLTLAEARAYADRQHTAYRAAGLPERADYGSQNSGPGQLPCSPSVEDDGAHGVRLLRRIARISARNSSSSSSVLKMPSRGQLVDRLDRALALAPGQLVDRNLTLILGVRAVVGAAGAHRCRLHVVRLRTVALVRVCWERTGRPCR